jgi:hypothetical protein
MHGEYSVKIKKRKDRTRFESRQQQKIFRFSKSFRVTLDPNRTSDYWTPDLFSGMDRLGL